MRPIRKLLTLFFERRSPTSRGKSDFKRRLFLVRVSGESAWPVLIPDKTYFATSLLNLRLGDWIVFRNPLNAGEVYVKAIEEITPEGFLVRGTVSWASSSDNFGEVKKESVLGKLLLVHAAANRKSIR